MEPQQFCLKWNNYQSNLVHCFDELLADESFVDVTLACDGKSLKAHKIILSACSSFFKELFKNNPCQHPIVILRDIKYEDLKAILVFIYHGEVNIVQNQLNSFLGAAECLKISGLADADKSQPVLTSELATSKEEVPPESFSSSNESVKNQQSHPKLTNRKKENNTSCLSPDSYPTNTNRENSDTSLNSILHDEDQTHNHNSKRQIECATKVKQEHHESSPRRPTITKDIASCSKVDSQMSIPNISEAGMINQEQYGISMSNDDLPSSKSTNSCHPLFSDSENEITIQEEQDASDCTNFTDIRDMDISSDADLKTGNISYNSYASSSSGLMANHQSDAEIASFLQSTFQEYSLQSTKKRGRPLSNKYPVGDSCPVCKHKYSNRASLIRHMSMHSTNRKRYSCEHCNKSFFWKTNLCNHKKTCHSSSSEFSK